MKKYFHGENSITFSLLGGSSDKCLSRLFCNASWNAPIDVRPEQIKSVHLFPNFGKRYGYGEPDAIVITEHYVIYVEVELADLTKRKLPASFVKQMNKFVTLASDLTLTNRRRLIERFQGESGYAFYGKQSLRRIFDQIKAETYTPAFLVISDGKAIDPADIISRSGIRRDIILGWIGFKKIKAMKGISEVVRTINHVLKP